MSPSRPALSFADTLQQTHDNRRNTRRCRQPPAHCQQDSAHIATHTDLPAILCAALLHPIHSRAFLTSGLDAMPCMQQSDQSHDSAIGTYSPQPCQDHTRPRARPLHQHHLQVLLLLLLCQFPCVKSCSCTSCTPHLHHHFHEWVTPTGLLKLDNIRLLLLACGRWQQCTPKAR
jgi:hypothetical protein